MTSANLPHLLPFLHSHLQHVRRSADEYSRSADESGRLVEQLTLLLGKIERGHLFAARWQPGDRVIYPQPPYGARGATMLATVVAVVFYDRPEPMYRLRVEGQPGTCDAPERELMDLPPPVAPDAPMMTMAATPQDAAGQTHPGPLVNTCAPTLNIRDKDQFNAGYQLGREGSELPDGAGVDAVRGHAFALFELDQSRR